MDILPSIFRLHKGGAKKPWFRLNLGSKHVRARTAGVFASTCVVGLIVNVLAILLDAVNFAPLQAIVAADDRLFFSIVTPTIQDVNKLHRVVLVDIDDDAMPPKNVENGGSTPRALVANLIHQIRDQNPVAIFVDLDLRDASSDDGLLQAELAKRHQPRVLIPYFPESLQSGCKDQDRVTGQRPIVLGSAFRAASAGDSVTEVHSVLETGGYGLVEGTCSAILVRQQPALPAAMIVAAGLAGHKVSTTPLRLIHPLWRIRDKQEGPGGPRNPQWGSSGQSLYTWIPAADLAIAPKNLFKSAIVIVGSSHVGAEDVHYTPVGPMIGSLIQVNLAIALQQDDLQQREAALYGWQTKAWQAAFDTVLTVLTAAAVTLVCWHPLHLRLGSHGKPTPCDRWRRLLGEIGILLLMWLLAAGGVLLLAPLGHGLALWRYTFISSLLSAAFVVLMEGTFLVGETTRDQVEDMVLHRRRRSGMMRSRK